MDTQAHGAALEQAALRCFTLGDWIEWRQAHGLDLLAAAHQLMADMANGALIAQAQRDRDGAVLH